MTLMRAARLHAIGEPMSIDDIEVPKPRPTDVLVRVKACGIVPNMANVINNWPTWFPHQPLPRFPPSSAWTSLVSSNRSVRR